MAATDGMIGVRRKILYVLDEFPGPHGGTESQFWLLVKGLDRLKFEPTILLLRQSPYLAEHAGDIPVRVLGVPRLKSLPGLARIARAARWARREGFRVAHIFLNDCAIVFPMPLRLAGLKVIVSRRDLGFWYTRANLIVLRWQAKFVAAVVANSTAVRDAVEKAEGFAPGVVRLIYNGLQKRPVAGPAPSRDAYGIPAGVQLLVMVANLRPLKRVSDAVRAISRLAIHHGIVTHLLVVGEDREGEAGPSHRGELAQLAASLEVGARVHFAGRLDDPMPAIAMSDVGVLVSDTEGLSNAVIEYMSAGKPVVASNVGGNAELVENSVTGYLVPPRDVEQLATALATVLGDKALAAQLGAAGAQRARRLFGAEAMIKQHETLYEDLLAVNSRAAAR